MRTDIQTRFRTVRKVCGHKPFSVPPLSLTTLVTTKPYNAKWPAAQTPCHDTLYINNRPYQARYRGQRYWNSNFAYSSLRVHFITDTLSFCREQSPWTLCCTPKQHIPAGHGKTNRNTTIKFDFALQSARARSARNLSLSFSLSLSLPPSLPCATIEAAESFAWYAERRRIICCCSSDPSYQQESSALHSDPATFCSC
jgi:hypothetical protein